MDVCDACVLVHFVEAVDEPNMIKTQCGMTVPTVSLAMAHMHPLHVVSVCMVPWACCNSFPQPVLQQKCPFLQVNSAVIGSSYTNALLQIFVANRLQSYNATY